MPLPPPNDPRFADPMSRAPAGYSLTQPKGKWAWDNPPRFADPEEALEYVFKQVEKPQTEQRYLKLMLAGITIEEIVNSLAIGGFISGTFSVDVAELIKGPLAIHFMGVAAENRIPVRVVSTADGLPDRSDGLDDETILNIMRQKNPEVYRQVVARNNQAVEELSMREMEQQQIASGSFLGVEE